MSNQLGSIIKPKLQLQLADYCSPVNTNRISISNINTSKFSQYQQVTSKANRFKLASPSSQQFQLIKNSSIQDNQDTKYAFQEQLIQSFEKELDQLKEQLNISLDESISNFQNTKKEIQQYQQEMKYVQFGQDFDFTRVPRPKSGSIRKTINPATIEKQLRQAEEQQQRQFLSYLLRQCNRDYKTDSTLSIAKQIQAAIKRISNQIIQEKQQKKANFLNRIKKFVQKDRELKKVSLAEKLKNKIFTTVQIPSQ